MCWRNLVVLAAAMSAFQVDAVAGPGDPIEDVGVGLGKKPNPGLSIIIQKTDLNGRVQFFIDTPGTYEISIRQPGGISGVPLGAAVQLSGNMRAVGAQECRKNGRGSPGARPTFPPLA